MKWCRAELALYLIIAILGLGNILTACGQKGPLYLPTQTSNQPSQQHPTHWSKTEWNKTVSLSETRPVSNMDQTNNPKNNTNYGLF